MTLGLLFLVPGWGAAGRVASTRLPAQSAVPLNSAEAKPVVVIQAYTDGLAGVRAANPEVHLSVDRDPTKESTDEIFKGKINRGYSETQSDREETGNFAEESSYP